MSRVIETFVNVYKNQVVNVNDNYVISSEDDTINVGAGSAEIEIVNNNFNVGKRLLIRKVSSSAGEIEIDFTGGTVTRAELEKVTLTSDGDFWLVEKVSSDRWELVDGFESGSNENGEWRRESGGNLVCKRLITYNFSVAGQIAYTFPVNFIGGRQQREVYLGYFNTIDPANFKALSGYCTADGTWVVRNDGTGNNTTLANELHLKAEGRWY